MAVQNELRFSDDLVGVSVAEYWPIAFSTDLESYQYERMGGMSFEELLCVTNEHEQQERTVSITPDSTVALSALLYVGGAAATPLHYETQQLKGPLTKENVAIMTFKNTFDVYWSRYVQDVSGQVTVEDITFDDGATGLRQTVVVRAALTLVDAKSWFGSWGGAAVVNGGAVTILHGTIRSQMAEMLNMVPDYLRREVHLPSVPG